MPIQRSTKTHFFIRGPRSRASHAPSNPFQKPVSVSEANGSSEDERSESSGGIKTPAHSCLRHSFAANRARSARADAALSATAPLPATAQHRRSPRLTRFPRSPHPSSTRPATAPSPQLHSNRNAPPTPDAPSGIGHRFDSSNSPRADRSRRVSPHRACRRSSRRRRDRPRRPRRAPSCSNRHRSVRRTRTRRRLRPRRPAAARPFRRLARSRSARSNSLSSGGSVALVAFIVSASGSVTTNSPVSSALRAVSERLSGRSERSVGANITTGGDVLTTSSEPVGF